MKVRCIKMDNWVTVGKEYLVLGIYGRGSSFKYRLIGDDNHTPALQDAELFDLVSSRIPMGWMFMVYPGMEWEMTPAPWTSEGFWTKYFDGESGANALFAQVRAALEEQEQ